MKKMLRFVLIFLLFLFIFNDVSSSQNFTKSLKEKATKIDSLLIYLHQNKQFNGNILIAIDGKIILEKSYGYSDIEKQIPLEANSCFQLASISKQFTAVAIMILKEKGKLDYDDTITKFIPEFPYYGIKVRHLLTHTSGLPDYLSLFSAKWDTAVSELKNRKIAINKDVIEMLKIHKPEILFKPGEKYEYSNTGYLLLASIVESVSGENFDNFLEKHIFKPLKMKNTLVYSQIKKQPIINRALGYRLSWDSETTQPNDIGYLDGTYGDKGVYSNVQDLFIWDRALYNPKFIKKNTLREAHTRAKLNNDSAIRYGFGWFVDTTEGKAEVWHTGTWYGFRNRFLRQIDENNTIIVLSNNSITPRTEIVSMISNIIHDKEYNIPKLPVSLVLGKIIKSNGINAAIDEFKKIKESGRKTIGIEEDDLNSLGYRLLRSKMIKESIEILKINTTEFPESYNVFDSLGDAYLADSNNAQALINYAKSLSKNPFNFLVINKITKTGAELRLSRVK